MEAVLGVLFFFASCLAVLCSVAGLFRPRLVLWWAMPEKQTRGRAFWFAIFVAVCCFAVVAALMPQTPWWAWLVTGFLFFLLLGCVGSFTGLESKPKEDEETESCPYLAETDVLCPFDYNSECCFAEGSACPHPPKGQCPCPKGNITQVPSFTGNRVYSVDTMNMSCTCPDWVESRAEFEALDPRRLCKHLVREVTRQALDLDYFPDHCETIIKLFNQDRGYPRGRIKTNLSNSYDDDADDYWKEEWRVELELFFTKKVTSDDEQRLREIFGGDEQCLYNFRMYAARWRKGKIVCFIPIGDHYRPRFDVLARSGIARQGIASVQDMLPFLSMDGLRRLADALQCKRGRSKQELCENLLACEEEKILAAWAMTGMELKDFFSLGVITIT